MMPNEYLYYYYFTSRGASRRCRPATSGPRSSSTAARLLRRATATPLALVARPRTPSARRPTWRRPGPAAGSRHGRDRRRSGARRLRRLALQLVDALYGDGPRVMILERPNRSSLPFLDEEAVVEVPCVVGRGGIVPVAIGDVPMEAQGLILQVRAAERAAIDAALSGSRSRGAAGPRAASAGAFGRVAERILDGYLTEHPTLAGPIHMTVDVVCAGAPFLDITFSGLDAVAGAGRGAHGRAGRIHAGRAGQRRARARPARVWRRSICVARG